VEVLHARGGGGGGRSRPAPSRRVPHRRWRADPREASSASPAQRRVPGVPESSGDARSWGAGQAGARRSNRGGVVAGGATVQLTF
jgi:hypothetical protein